MAGDTLISRQEILGGLAAKRARMLVYLIENRAAHLAARSRTALDRYPSEQGERERELAFMEALALGREPPQRPTVQELEQFAPEWAALVPDTPRLRAAIAHILGAKYRIVERATPRLRAALGLDTVPVQQAYASLYGVPPASLYTPAITPLERLRWARTAFAKWVDALPPFWTAFAMTLIEVVGGCVLALPIAFARMGPLGGVVVLLVIGLLNVLTLAAIAETMTRTGSVRYDNAYFGRIVAQYLGEFAASIVVGALALIFVIFLVGYYVGFGSTLSDATGIHQGIWIALLFLLGLYFLSRGSLNSTIASAMLVGAVNLGLLVTLLLVTLPHLKPEYLAFVNVPLMGGTFDASILELIFGVALSAYFGHSSIGSCARLVLRRDPSGRSLFWGAVAAQLTAVVLYAVWVFAVNGAISPQVLAAQKGTALVPLADTVGPVVYVIGAVFVTLGMGMGSISLALGLYSIVAERLPSEVQPVLLLPRGKGRLQFRRRGGEGFPCLALTYMGMTGRQARFRLQIQTRDQTRRTEIAISGEWDIASLLARYPELCGTGAALRITLLDANPEYVRLRVMTRWMVEPPAVLDEAGIDWLDVLSGSNDEWGLIQWILSKRTVSVADVAEHTSQDEAATRAHLDALVKQGSLETKPEGSEVRYRVHLRRKRASGLSADLWDALDHDGRGQVRRGQTGSHGLFAALAEFWHRVLAGPRGRWLISVSPVFVIFLAVEGIVFMGAESFTGAINFGGVIVAPVFAGIFPVLLLLASRRKGDMVPGVVYGLLGNRVLLAAVYLLFLASLIAHGLVIWQEPVPRAAALLSALVTLWMTAGIVRHGALTPRVVVRLQQTEGDADGQLEVTSGGRTLPAATQIHYASGPSSVPAGGNRLPQMDAIRSVQVQLPTTTAREIKVWAHRITALGDAEELPAHVALTQPGGRREFELSASDNQRVYPLDNADCQVEIRFGTHSS